MASRKKFPFLHHKFTMNWFDMQFPGREILFSIHRGHVIIPTHAAQGLRRNFMPTDGFAPFAIFLVRLSHERDFEGHRGP